MKEYKFERLARPTGYCRSHKAVFISISRLGLLRCSSGFFQKNGITRDETVILSYDDKNTAIGLEFIDKADECACVSLNKDSAGGASFSCKSLFNIYDIHPTTVSGRYEPFLHTGPDGKKIWVIDLNIKAQQ